MKETAEKSQKTNTETSVIVDGLWNTNLDLDNYGTATQYHEHVFEQYKLCVEMADRISARRNLSNTFFLTLHTLLISTARFIFDKDIQVENVWLNLFPLIAVLALCYVWFRIIQSYRQLNNAKYLVIGEFESRLPTSPYYQAEWKILGEGKKTKLYTPLTNVEKYVPAVFAFTYLLVFLMLLAQAYS